MLTVLIYLAIGCAVETMIRPPEQLKEPRRSRAIFAWPILVVLMFVMWALIRIGAAYEWFVRMRDAEDDE